MLIISTSYLVPLKKKLVVKREGYICLMELLALDRVYLLRNNYNKSLSAYHTIIIPILFYLFIIQSH